MLLEPRKYTLFADDVVSRDAEARYAAGLNREFVVIALMRLDGSTE